MSTATLSDIITKVRKLTGTGNSLQLTDSNIIDYINSFYLYDFPSEFRSLQLKNTITINTIQNVDTYAFDFDHYETVEAPVFVDKPFDRKDLEDYSQGTGRLEYIVSATDYNELVERCLVIKGFYNETIEDMVTYLIDNFFTSYGITAGTISAITVVNKVPLGYVFGHSALNHLRNFGNYVWNIDKNKQLSFQQRGDVISSGFDCW